MKVLQIKTTYESKKLLDEFNEAVEYAEDIDALEDSLHELADATVDIYNQGLTEWLASDINNAFDVDEAINEYGWDSERGIFGAIAMGQYKQNYDLFYQLFEAYKEAQND
jgi:hypothetical protein